MERATGPAAMDEDGTRRRWLVLLPWVVAAALLVAGWTLDPGSRPPARSTVAAAGTPPGPAATAAAPTLPASVELDVRTASRRALGWHGLSGDLGPRDRWVVDQALEDPRALADGTAEVVVRATVIVRADEGWHGPETAAVRVPLVTTPRLAVAGPAQVLHRSAPTATHDPLDREDRTDHDERGGPTATPGDRAAPTPTPPRAPSSTPGADR